MKKVKDNLDKQQFLINEYNHYSKTKRFGFTSRITFNNATFKKNEFDELKNQLNEKNEAYKYIVSKLDGFELIEFKNDYYDQLVKMRDQQVYTKNKFLFDKYIEKINTPTKPTNNKTGRKSHEIKEAKDYLRNIDVPETKEKFILFLKETFKDQQPKAFASLMSALDKEGFINISSSKIGHKEAFEKILSDKSKIGTQSNFNNHLNSPDEKHVNSIITTIKNRKKF